MTTSFTTVVEIEFTAGAWTDVSAWVDGPVVVDRSVASVTQEAQPGTCTFTLVCADPSTGAADARFMPDSPLSPHYPNVVEDKRVRVSLAKAGGGASSVRFLGWISSLVPVWAATLAESTVAVTATDGLGRLGRYRSSGWTALVAAGMSGVEVAPLASSLAVTGQPTWAALVKAGRRPTFDTEALTPLDPAGCVRLESTSVSDTVGFDASTFLAGRNGFAFWVRPIKGAPAGSGYSTAGAFFYDDNWLLRLTDELVIEGWYFSAPPEVCYFRIATNGEAKHLAFSEGVGIFVDGVLIPGTSFLTMGGVGYGARFYAAGGSTTVQVSNLVSRSSALSATQVGLLAGAGGTATLADLVSALDDAAGALASVTADSGMGSKAAAGASLDAAPTGLDLARLIASSEGSPVWDDGTGVRFTAREYQTSPAITIDVEADMDGQATLSRDAEGRVAIGKASNWRRSKQETDASLAADLGDVSGEVVTVLGSELDLDSRASLRISDGRDAKTRLSAVAFDLATAANDLYAAFWALKPGQHARVTAIPSTLLGLTYVEQRVLGFTEVIGVGSCLVTLNLGTPIAGRPVQTVARHGFGEGVASLSAGITSSATTISIAFTSTAGLSTSGADYPFAINVNGERMTLNSAPGGSSSPQTFTGVTRGVAPTVARAHSAGESVELWNPLQVGY